MHNIQSRDGGQSDCITMVATQSLLKFRAIAVVSAVSAQGQLGLGSLQQIVVILSRFKGLSPQPAGPVTRLCHGYAA